MSVTIDAKPQPMPEPPLPKAEPCVVVIFGASGDLTKRMLVPALARLWQAESLPPSFAILGVDLKQMTDDEFRQHLREGIFAAGGDGDGITEESWSRFAERLSYIKGELENDQTYRSIREKLERLASQGSSANHLFYCSTPPTLAPAIVKGLFRLRGRIGALFGWDEQRPAWHAESYVHRLSEEDRTQSLVAPGTPDGNFRLLYRFEDEQLSELRNATVHAFVSLSIRQTPGGYLAYLGVFVQPVHRFTRLYMGIIAPFRRLVVYPAVMRKMQRAWVERYGGESGIESRSTG